MSKTTLRKGKQDDKFSLAIREVQGWTPENKKCFDCEQRGPTYVNATVGSFVCTKCSGMLRGMNPPHRIKSISMSTFTAEEVEFMRTRGNAWCSKIWLARWDQVNQPVDFKDDDKVKEFMISKYEKKRFYSEANERAARSSPSISSLSSNSSQDNKPLSSLIGSTIKAHMAYNHAAHISAPSSVIPRSVPSAVPRPQDKMTQPSRPAQPPPPSFQQPPPPSFQQPPPPSFQQPPPPSFQQPPPPTFQQSSTPLATNTTPQNSSDAFANFANFDTAAFESLPSDPLSAVPAFPAGGTLPPIKKVSQGSLGNGQADYPTVPGTINKIQKNTHVEAANSTAPATSINRPMNASDRYSALKELDDLFKTATIQSPVAGSPAPHHQQQQPTQQHHQVTDPIFGVSGVSNPQINGSAGGGSNLFADLSSAAVNASSNNTITTSDTHLGRLSPAANWVAASSGGGSVASAAAPWVTGGAWNTSTSPNSAVNNTNWDSSTTQAVSSSASSLWGGGTGASNGGEADNGGSLWAGTNGSTPATNNTTGWAWNQPTSNTLQPAAAMAIGGGNSSSHNQDIWASASGGGVGPSTNPFGTSPSSTSTGGGLGLGGANFTENNNDLFAAAPKPFNDKSGNPWVNVPVFTQNMTPAPNPNNPFL